MKLIIAMLTSLLAATTAIAQDAYQVRSGDVLRVEVLEDTSLNRETPVLPDGRISFPFVGTVPVSGRSLDEIASNLSQSLAPNFAAPPSVFVSLATVAPRVTGPSAPRTITAYVLGEVAAPGPKEIEPGTTILQFLSQTGGFTRFAATKRVQLRRTDPQTGAQNVYLFNYNAVERGAAITGSTVLIEGDVIIVPERRLFE